MPTISSVVPSTGTAGDTITINGTGFTGVTEVTLSEASVSFVFVSSIKITFTVPVEGGGAYDVAVKVAGTVVDTGAFTVEDAAPIPTVTEVLPAFAAEGTLVTLFGSGLGTVNTVHVGSASLTYGGYLFSPVAGEFFTLSDGQIQFLMPHLTDGSYDITFDYDNAVTARGALTVT